MGVGQEIEFSTYGWPKKWGWVTSTPDSRSCATQRGGTSAALNRSAFNFADALGPWLGGWAFAADYGLTPTGWAGCGLALGGLAIWAISRHADTRLAGTGPAGIAA
jgi:predicted MFS family arabinose efflux permease